MATVRLVSVGLLKVCRVGVSTPFAYFIFTDDSSPVRASGAPVVSVKSSANEVSLTPLLPAALLPKSRRSAVIPAWPLLAVAGR